MGNHVQKNMGNAIEAWFFQRVNGTDYSVMVLDLCNNEYLTLRLAIMQAPGYLFFIVSDVRVLECRVDKRMLDHFYFGLFLFLIQTIGSCFECIQIRQ